MSAWIRPGRRLEVDRVERREAAELHRDAGGGERWGIAGGCRRDGGDGDRHARDRRLSRPAAPPSAQGADDTLREERERRHEDQPVDQQVVLPERLEQLGQRQEHAGAEDGPRKGSETADERHDHDQHRGVDPEDLGTHVRGEVRVERAGERRVDACHHERRDLRLAHEDALRGCGDLALSDCRHGASPVRAHQVPRDHEAERGQPDRRVVVRRQVHRPAGDGQRAKGRGRDVLETLHAAGERRPLGQQRLHEHAEAEREHAEVEAAHAQGGDRHHERCRAAGRHGGDHGERHRNRELHGEEAGGVGADRVERVLPEGDLSRDAPHDVHAGREERVEREEREELHPVRARPDPGRSDRHGEGGERDEAPHGLRHRRGPRRPRLRSPFLHALRQDRLRRLSRRSNTTDPTVGDRAARHLSTPSP